MKNTESFYKDLPALDSFSEIFSQDRFAPVPDDWWVALTDVVGSTKAIEAGRYKDVNTAGSVGVMAIGNHLQDMTFPFVFGGDGMTCLIPPSAAPAVRDLLAGTGLAVRESLGLDLRTALVPVKALKDLGKTLSLAKWRVSPYYCQAILEGDGVDQAETFLKTPGSPYLLDPETPTTLTPDFTGYTCRWQDFPSPYGETVALLVKFRNRDQGGRRKILQDLETIIGGAESRHPLRLETSRMAFWNTKRLNNEAAIMTGRSKGWKAFLYRLKTRFFILCTVIWMAFKIHVVIHDRDISRSKEDNIQSSDFRKYDNTLKMILALPAEVRQRLETYLETHFRSGDLYYGIHRTDRAMITCLLQHSGEGEVHFVDAADGGYTYAAKMMKQQKENALS